MEKKKYISPKFYIVRIEGESLMDDFNFEFGSGSGDAESKQQIFTDDDWEDDWEE